jgi:hypothetical protein
MTWPSEQTRAARESHHPCGASGGSGAGASGAVPSDAAVGSLWRDRTRERTVEPSGEIAILDGPPERSIAAGRQIGINHRSGT